MGDSPIGSSQQRTDFVVAGLRKVRVPQPYRMEGLRRSNADHIISDCLQGVTALACTDRDGHCDVRRPQLAHGLHGCPYCCAGGQPVIDNDYLPPLHWNGRMIAAIQRLSSLQLEPLARNDSVDLRSRDTPQEAVGFGVHDDHSAARDGPDCEFLMPRMPDLAHHQDVKRSLELPRNFGADGNTASGQRQHHRILPAALLQQGIAESSTGVAPIAEPRSKLFRASSRFEQDSL